MAFTKKTYTAGQTKVPADNLNEIQDEIIRQAALPHLTQSQVEAVATSAAATEIAKLPECLPLAGGTMDAGGSIKHPGNASAWNKGRENAVLRRPNAPTGEAWYYPLVSSKTVNGDWTIGNLGDGLYVNYTEDALYNSTTNSNTHQFLFNSDGNFFYPGGKTLIVSGTLGASASSTLSASFDGRIFKNLVVLIRSVANNGNKYSTFTIPAIADVWGLFLPIYNNYYRVAITISGSGSGMSVMLQMDSDVSGTPAYIYGTA